MTATLTEIRVGGQVVERKTSQSEKAWAEGKAYWAQVASEWGEPFEVVAPRHVIRLGRAN